MSHDNPTADHVTDERSESDIEKNLKSRPTWLRLVFMIVFYVLISVAAMVSTVVVALGFLWVLFTGAPNPQLQRFGQSLAIYLNQVMRYLTFNTDEKPFPFTEDWPIEHSDVSAD